MRPRTRRDAATAAGASPDGVASPAVAQSADAHPFPRPLPMTTLICDCNKTMPLDGPALRRALGPEAGAGLETVHSTLCRREAGAFQRAAKSGEQLLVACTQESRLFLELNEETEGAASVAERPIRFVNIREIGRLVEGRARRRCRRWPR